MAVGSINLSSYMVKFTVASGGNLVAVVGRLMGMICPSIFAKVAWTSCESSNWISDSSLVSKRTSKMGILSSYEVLQVSFSDNQRMSVHNNVSGKTKDEPHVLVRCLTALSLSSSQVLTIQGFTHPNCELSSKIKFGATSCLDTAWTSSSSILCKMHSAASVALKIRVSLGDEDYEWVTRSYRSNATASSFQPSNGPATGSSLIQMFGGDFGTFDFSSRKRSGETACEISAWRSSSKISSKSARMKHGETIRLILSATNLYVQEQFNSWKTDTNDPSFNISEISFLQTPSSDSIQVSIFGRTVLVTDVTASVRIW
jgi:hypothetical protein